MDVTPNKQIETLDESPSPFESRNGLQTSRNQSGFKKIDLMAEMNQADLDLQDLIPMENFHTIDNNSDIVPPVPRDLKEKFASILASSFYNLKCVWCKQKPPKICVLDFSIFTCLRCSQIISAVV
jgi:hypothetical protein